MLLFELGSENFVPYLHTIFGYVESGDTHGLDLAARKAIYTFPNCVYKGKMFRILDNDFEEDVRNEVPLQYVAREMHAYAITNKRKVFGWSKNMDGISNLAYKSELFGGFVIEQHHVGLDVYKLYQQVLSLNHPEFDEEYFAYTQVTMKEEQEILSAMSNVHLAGFFMNEFCKFYDVNDYDKLLSDYKELMEI